MKIDFLKVIFMDESLTFDGPDWLTKWLILSSSDMPVVKRRQQKDSSMMIWAGIVDQPLLMKELNWTLLTIAISWIKLFFPG